jgi:nucleotide-binding universal stress UspA family protein
MTIDTEPGKVLVVLSPDLIRPDEPAESVLINRAIELAKATGCRLELFHACFDSLIDYHVFTSDDERRQQREAITNRDATLLAEMATRLSSDEGINVSHEVRWDYPRTDAILRKITETKPDIVMKHSREHSYLLGISSNTDWDLARRSPVHVWLVSDKTKAISRIVAAVGNQPGDITDITTAADYDLFRTAGSIARGFGAKIFPVNAFQTVGGHAYLVSAGAVAPPAPALSVNRQMLAKQLERHESAVQAFAQYFQIDADNVRVREGHPSEVITSVASELDADLIVMGARSMSRLERMVRSVTVEPVLAEAECDILIVRDDDKRSGAAVARKAPVRGVPKYDVEKAVVAPQETFRSPGEVAEMTEISVDLRHRILQAWEYDVRAALAEENEGGPARDVDANAIDEIRDARARLEDLGKTQDPQMQLSIASK